MFNVHPRFVNGLQECLEMIFAFKYLCAKLKVLRDTPYSSDKDEDEDKVNAMHANIINQASSCASF